MDFSIFRHAYALSGGIGSGKSSVCEILSLLGYPIINADAIAHVVLGEKIDEVINAFGEGVCEGGEISRAKLGKIVFSDRGKLRQLEGILSSGIGSRIFSQCTAYEELNVPFFAEIPLLFEQRHVYNFPRTILVVCSEDEQIRRTSQRSQLTQEEVRARIAMQLPLEEKMSLAWKIFRNDGDKRDLQEKLERWLGEELGFHHEIIHRI